MHQRRREHETPITEAALAALESVRQRCPGIGDAPIFPAPKNSPMSVSRHLMRDWWRQAEKLAEMEPRRGRGWHSFRRKFASDYVDQPLKVLADLGGWRSTQTIIECYQKPDQERLKEALLMRRKASNGTE